MLKLQNLHIQISSRLFTPQTKKHLRISVGNIVRTTTQPSKFISEQSLQWTQSMQFPLLYNKQFAFQIFDTHQFGYNPGQLQSIMEGKIVIDSLGDNRGTWQIFDSQGKQIGYLSGQIVSKVPAMIRSLISNTNTKVKQANPEQPVSQSQNTKILRIKSMVSRIPNQIIKRAYILVQVGNQSIKSTELKSRSGQLVFIEPRQISLQPNDTDARVKIISIKSDDTEDIIAEGSLQLIGAKPSKKVVLMRDGQEVGEIFIESKIADKNQINNASFVSNSYRQANTEAINSEQQIQESSIQPRTKSISPSKSIDFTKLEHFGIQNNSRLSSYRSPNMLDSSFLSASTVRRRNSVLNQNNNVVFPKERRFMVYQDRQNQRVTYLNDRSFEFRTQKSGSRYRGASIGYGGKTDFTRAKRDNPGVGNYKLPSIWDRY